METKTKLKSISYLMWIDLIAMITMFLTRGIDGKIAFVFNITSGMIALPLFAFILGNYLKQVEKDKNWSIMKWALVIFFVVNISSILIKQSNQFVSIITNPATYSWILLGIPIWWMASNILQKSKNGFISSILIAILVGNIEGIGTTLGLVSIAALFPFFYYGWEYKGEKEKKGIIPKTFVALLALYGIFQFHIEDSIFCYETGLVLAEVESAKGFVIETFLGRIAVYPIAIMAMKWLILAIEKLKLDKKLEKLQSVITIEGYLLGTMGAIIGAEILRNTTLFQEINRHNLILAIISGVTIVLLIPIIYPYAIRGWKKIEEKGKGRKEEKKKVKKEKIEAPNVFLAFLNSNYMVLILGIILILKTALMYCDSMLAEEMLPEVSIYVAAAIGYIACMLIPLFCIPKNKTRMTWILIFDLFVSALLFADDLYYNYSKNYISVYQIGNLQYGGEISATLPMLIKPIHICYFVDSILLLVIRIKYIKNEYKTKNLPARLTILVCISLMLPFIPNFQEAAWYPYDKIAQVKAGSIYGYHIQDFIKSSDFENKVAIKKEEELKKSYEEVRKYYEEEGYLKSEYHGVAEGKNVIVVQLESVGDFPIHQKYNGVEITPNLNKFFDENIRCTNSYMQSFSSTADAEFAAATSLFPLENGMSFSKYPNVTYPDIFHILKTKGNYTTAVLHGNDGNFWNRAQAYKSFGVEKLFFENTFDEGVTYYMYYIADEEVYDKAIKEMKNEEGNFYYSIVLASSHIPFTLVGMNDSIRANLAIQRDGTELGDYLQSVNYADKAFGDFIQELKDNGLYEDSIILVYGDHTGYSSKNNEDLQRYLETIRGEKQNTTKLWLEDLRVAMGIHIPGVKGGKQITKPISKIDIKPTVLDLLGIEDEFSVGTTVFGTKDYADLNNGNIITSTYYRNGNVWYEVKTGKQVQIDSLSEEMKEKLTKMEYYNTKQIDISQGIPAKDLLKNRTF